MASHLQVARSYVNKGLNDPMTPSYPDLLLAIDHVISFLEALESSSLPAVPAPRSEEASTNQSGSESGSGESALVEAWAKGWNDGVNWMGKESLASLPTTEPATTGALSDAPDAPTEATTQPSSHPLGVLTEAALTHVEHCFECRDLAVPLIRLFRTHVQDAGGTISTSAKPGSPSSAEPAPDGAASPSSSYTSESNVGFAGNDY